MTARRGFEELPHTADWAIKVWAEDLPALFGEAARGMNVLAGTEIAAGPRVNREFAHEGGDRETMLVAFLSELVYLEEHEHLGFDSFQFEFPADGMRAGMTGAPLIALAKPIKAVTFHDLKIQETPTGLETQIVFDV